MTKENKTDETDDDLPPSHPPPDPPLTTPTSPNYINEAFVDDTSFDSVDLNDNNGTNNIKLKSFNNNVDINNNNHCKMEKDDKEEETSKEETEIPSVSFFQLFKYSTKLDKLYIIFGSIFAILLGCTFPAITLLFGNLSDVFVEYAILDSLAKAPDIKYRQQYYEDVLKKVNNISIYYEDIKHFPPYMVKNKYNESTVDLDQIRTRLGFTIEQIVEIFNNSIFQNGTLYVDKFRHDSGQFCGLMALIAILFGLVAYLALSLWEKAARNQNYQIKITFFRSIINQDIEWFDMKGSGDFATKITADLNLIQQGMGDKIALTIMAFATLIFSIVNAFYHGWELTLVTMAVVPILGIAFALIGKIQTKYAANESEAYSKAGSIAEEVFNLIRTVYAFGGQQKEIDRYSDNIVPAKQQGIKRSMFSGISLGVMFFGIYSSYGLAFWYGVNLIIRSIKNEESPPKYQASTLLIVFFNVLMGAFSLGQTTPYFEAISRALGAAKTIFKVMEQKPKIDSLSPNGKRHNINGRIKFRNVHFSYPNRKDVPVLNDLNLDAEPGQTIALVGASGCGKSTIIQLIQRFYDPDKGDIFIDEENIKDINVGLLRKQIGVVGQEPVLFDYSIKQNISFGNTEATFEDVIQAAKEANAYDFIQNLPDKFETLVGERGAQLSGGQKQRIAIARALIRKPKILLLDESTSALDSESEAIVQTALDKASIGRTTFVVAHRLSTIRNADKIVVIEQGRIKEIGTHQELIDSKGIYYQMARLQNQDKRLSLTPAMIDANLQRQQQQQQQGVKVERTKSIDTAKSSQMDNDKYDEDEDENQTLPLKRLIEFVKPDKWYLTIATICSLISGLSIPVYAFVFGEVLSVISDRNTENMSNQILKYCLIYFAMGIIAGSLHFIQTFLYGISSENLTFRMRKQVFQTILQQEIGWFDQKENSTGALCTRLASDAAAVQGATGSRLSVIAQTISILSAGVVISMYYNWKLSLVMLTFVPIILICVYFQIRILMGVAVSSRKNTERATSIAMETISNIRTVASLNLELTFWVNYQKALEDDFKKTRFEPHIKGGTFGLTQAVFNSAYAIALFYGSRLIIDGELDYSKLFKCTEAVIFGTNMIGQSVAFSPDYQKGRIAAVAIFKLLDRVPKIIVNSMMGVKPQHGCQGEINFEEVEFRYPTRSKARVLKSITFKVKPGETIALVGQSGCGKSTCTQIIERFYDIEHGRVLVDGQDLIKLNIPWLRSHIGIVQQEPMLFDKTIKENIAYGDNSREVPMEEIVRAAQQANAHDFIQNLPQKYDTPVGDKGAQLSGGQKQRIAIARALIRDPKILLLDEATSALDSESEKLVQQALDLARHGRTCLIIAHRLSTIKDVDKIFVIEDGYIAEHGTHDQLLELKGIYYQMYMAQMGANN